MMKAKMNLSWIAMLVLLICTQAAWGETFVVTSRENSGPGTLRQAIAASNTTTGVQTIVCQVPNSITVYSQIVITNTVIIEGNGVTIGSRSASSVAIFFMDKYTGSGGYDSSGSTLTGMALVHSLYAIDIENEVSDVRIMRCAIGTDWNNSSGQGNYIGINIGNGNRIFIGGDRLAGEGNVISGNSNYGVMAYGSNHVIAGNIFGLSSDQSVAINNGTFSMASADLMVDGTGNNRVGIALSGWGNVFGHSDNTGGTAIRIGGYNPSNNNYIQNNLIGISSTNGIHPFQYGVVFDKGTGNLVGGSNPVLDKNIFTGNMTHVIFYTGASSNTVVGNCFGTNVAGTQGIGDFSYITFYNTTTGNIIGTPNGGVGNLLYNTQLYAPPSTGLYQFYGNTQCGFAGSNTNPYVYNENIRPSSMRPVITLAQPTRVEGTSYYPGEYVEVYAAEANRTGGDQGGALRLLGYTTSSSGTGPYTWAVNVAGGLSAGNNVCALSTNQSQYGTSCYSTNVMVVTPTFTPTPSATATPTATPTRTSSPTATRTSTTTMTPTGTPTATASATVTPTLTVSATYTHSATHTITATVTPTLTVSATITQTATTTTTSTVTPTPTASPERSSLNLFGKKLLAYPNPGKEKITIAFLPTSNGEAKIQIYNMSGERVATLNAQVSGETTASVIWNCGSIAPGLYMVRVVQDGKEIGKTKVAVVR